MVIHNSMNGLVIKSLGGFYYVKADDGTVYPTRARGVFRKQHISPVVGDIVEISHIEDETASLDEIHNRKNYIERPPVANVDKLFLVVSTDDPKPNLLLIDKTIAVAEINKIEPVLVISKTDLTEYEELNSLYSGIGLTCIPVSKFSNEWIDTLKLNLRGCISVFTGNSGVGKSTILNRLSPGLNLNTGETSKKLGRGKHTTRHVELFDLGSESFVIDTPGFSTFELERYNITDENIIVNGFREFSEFSSDCRFTGCSHTCEKGCSVIEAVNDGKIAESRHNNFKTMYNEIKDLHKW